MKYLLNLNGQKLNSRADTTIRNAAKWSVLHVACYKGYTEIIKLLIDLGLNINDKTANGYTPLHLACQEGHYYTIKLLFDYNEQTLYSRVETAMNDYNRWSTLHAACVSGHTAIVNILMDIPLKLNDTTNKGHTPLYLACQNGNYDTVKFLLDLNGKQLNSRVDTTIKDIYGNSA